ncbi:unnamed protein product [Urochloa humidicola]
MASSSLPREEAAAASRNVKAKQTPHLQVAASSGGEHKPRPQQERGLKCPRCLSTNTKFCYYNNNSLTQPRFFCKACRRYWTVGGTQRNVSIGGGCRKNKQQNQPAPSSGSSDSNTMNISQQLMMLPTAVVPIPAEFPNVLPTFMPTTGGSASVELPTAGSNLPFAPLPLPSNPTGTMPSFLDMLRGGGGFLDGGSNRRVAPPILLPAPSFGALLQHVRHGMMLGDQQLHQQDVNEEVEPRVGEGAVQEKEQEQKVIVGGNGDTAPADDNKKGSGASAGSTINYWL